MTLFLRSATATYILVPGELSVGRLNCTIDLSEDRSVSRSHATIAVDADAIALTDNNSRYGTFVNTKQLPNGSSLKLRRGDVVRFGVGSSEFSVTDDIGMKLFCGDWIAPSCALNEAEYVVIDGVSVDVLMALGRAVPIRREFLDACLAQRRLLNQNDFVQQSVNREALRGYCIAGLEFFGSASDGAKLSVGCSPSTAWISEEDLWNACVHGAELRVCGEEKAAPAPPAMYYAQPSALLLKQSTPPLTGNHVPLLRARSSQDSGEAPGGGGGGVKRFVKNWPASRQGNRLPRIVNLAQASVEGRNRRTTPMAEPKKRRDAWFDEPPKQAGAPAQASRPAPKQQPAGASEGQSAFKSSFFRNLKK